MRESPKYYNKQLSYYYDDYKLSTVIYILL